MAKKKELTQLKGKTTQELTKILTDLRAKRKTTELALYSGRESNLKALKNLRREIAQILGIIQNKGQEKNK